MLSLCLIIHYPYILKNTELSFKYFFSEISSIEKHLFETISTYKLFLKVSLHYNKSTSLTSRIAFILKIIFSDIGMTATPLS